MLAKNKKTAFAVKHLGLHFAKTAGKIVTVSERADHENEINWEEIKENIPKALINTLRLAELAKMTEKEIVEDIESKYKDKLE